MSLVESLKLSEAHQDLLGNIRDIHLKNGMPFPVDECGSRFEDCIEIVEFRLALMPSIRKETALAIASHYGDDSDEAAAARIVEAVGYDLDQIFYAQLKQKGKEPMSWKAYSPQYATHLVDTIDALVADKARAQYFIDNPQSLRMLELLRHLATSDDRHDLVSVTDELEKLATTQYKARKPVLLFLLSDWYLRPNRGTEDIEVLEPDCRLILPYDEVTHEAITELVESATRDLAPFYPVPEWSEEPIGIIGDGVMWAGSQLVSYTVGEAFNGHGFVFVPNILKTYKNIVDVCERAGLVVPEDVVFGLTRQYILHELGHSYYHDIDPFMAEISTDLTTVIVILQDALEKSNEKLTEEITMLFGEYLEYTGTQRTGEASSDGYRISSIFVINKLLEYKLVEVGPDSRLRIHQDRKNCRKFIAELVELHQKLLTGDQSTANYLRAMELFPDMKNNFRGTIAASN